MKLFGEGGFKGFLALHVEKILFLLACLLAVLLILNGFGEREALDANKSPSNLGDQVQRTRRHIDEFQWTTHYEKDRDLDQEFLNRAKETLEPISIDSYSMNQTLRPPISPPPGRRHDPELVAPIDLQVRPGYGALSQSTSFRGGARGNAREDSSIFNEQIDDAKELLSEDNVRPIRAGIGTRGAGGRRQFSKGDEPTGVYFVAVTALFPLRDQFTKYQTALQSARGYDPTRDIPTVLDWELERTTVVADQEPKWEKIATLAALNEKDELRAPQGRVNRDADEADDFDPRLADEFLTMPVPNISTRNMSELVIHDRIHELTAEMEAKREDESKESSDQRGTKRQTDTRRSFQGPRGPSPYEEFERGDSPRRGPRGLTGSDRSSDLSGDMEPEEVPEFRMFRYIDRDVQPGTAYQYRLRLTLDDPNHPVLAVEPELDCLEPAVQIRVTSADRDQRGRTTEFSKPSEVVRVREGSVMLVGSVQPASETTMKNTTRRVRLPYAEPVAQVMALVFDQERATDIPMSLDVARGTVGNFSAKGIWVPVFWEGFSYKEDHVFQMDNLVLDISGGTQADPVLFKEDKSDGPKPKAYAELLTAPGQLLVLESSGQIRVHNELEDREAFQEIDQVNQAILEDIREERDRKKEESDSRQGRPSELGAERGAGREGIFRGGER